MAKREIDFSRKLVSAKTGPRARMVPIDFTAQVTRWDGKPLPEDHKWYLLHYGRLPKVVNQYGEEREGKKLVPLVANAEDKSKSAKAEAAASMPAFDFEKAFDKLNRENREIKRILSTIEGKLGEQQHVTTGDDGAVRSFPDVPVNADTPSEHTESPH